MPILVGISKECNQNVRSSVTQALEQIDGKDAVNALIDLFFEWSDDEDLLTQTSLRISGSFTRQGFSMVHLMEDRINLNSGLILKSNDIDFRYIRSQMKDDKYRGIYYLEKVESPHNLLNISKFIFYFSSDIRKAALNTISRNIEKLNDKKIVKKIQRSIWWLSSDPAIRLGAAFFEYEDELISSFEKTCNHLGLHRVSVENRRSFLFTRPRTDPNSKKPMDLAIDSFRNWNYFQYDSVCDRHYRNRAH